MLFPHTVCLSISSLPVWLLCAICPCAICAQVPDQLRQLFEKNYELLLSIFNPEGWLDITYVDSELRVGRDDKGNLFVLERTTQPAESS